MVTGLQPAGTLAGQGFAAPLVVASVTPLTLDGTPRFAVADPVQGTTRMLLPGAAGPVQAGTQWHAGPGVRLDLPGLSPGAIPDTVLDTVLLAGGRSVGAHLSDGALQARAVTLLAAQAGGNDILLGAAPDGAGVAAWRLGADGSPGARSVLGDTGGAYLANVSDLATLTPGPHTYVAAGSWSEHGISLLRLDPDGRLSPVTHLGMAESLPVQTVTALEPVTVAGQSYLVVAAAGSSSLTVLRVAADGGLSVTDHMIDEQATRFAGVTQLASAAMNGQAVVLAAGSDAGLTALRLTAEGRLVHLDSLADADGLALSGISGLAALSGPAGVEVLTVSGHEAGSSLFHLGFAPGTVVAAARGAVSGTAGDDMLSLTGGAGTISGGAGDDLISDGPGADRLTGGPGQDTFVLGFDGQGDTITDVRAGQDVVDLSLWPLFHGIDQLEIRQTGAGAVLGYRGEELTLLSHDGTTLSEADIAMLVQVPAAHYPVTIAALQVTEPGPAPVPVPPVTQPPVTNPPVTNPPVSGPPVSNPPVSNPPVTNPPVSEPPVTGPLRLVEGTEGPDVLHGGPGADMVAGRGGDDTLSGGAGDDLIAASGGNDLAVGGDGDDSLGGGPGNDTVQGDAGDDTIGGGLGHDTISGGTGDDVASGGPGDDWIDGDAGHDTLAGSFGNDTVRGHDGNDSLGGGTGRDYLSGGAGNDSLGGGEGDDTIRGGDGDDFLAGGGRDDLILGGDGRDRINGGAGNDRMEGGAGADVFIFNEFHAGETDVITDFQDGADTVRISGLQAGGGGIAALMAQLDLADTAGGALLTCQGQYVLFEGVAVAQLGFEDFTFL